MVTWTNTRAKCFCAWWHSQKYQSTSGGHVLLLKQVRTSRLEPHWGRVTHICVSRIIIIDSDNGLSPGRRQAIIWTNAGLLLIGPLGTNFSEILIEILTFSFKKMRLKVSSAKRRPFCLGLNVLRNPWLHIYINWVSLIYASMDHFVNERRRYIVTSSLIGWAHTQNYHLCCLQFPPTVMMFCDMREGKWLQRYTKFRNFRGIIVDRRINHRLDP